MRLREILVILVNNAINLTDVGEVVTNVNCINQSDELATVEFCVTDSGRGMTPCHIERLTEPSMAHRDDAAADQDRSDLEFNMCQELVQLMGGVIELKSTLGIGSTLGFTLIVPRGEIRTAQHTRPEQYTTAANCRILVVDDAADNRMLLGVYLKNQRADIEFAEDGVEALMMFKQRRYDIVLMDMHMPRMNGIEATKAMREFENLQRRSGPQRSAILAITADDSDNDQQRSLQAGCDAHLIKPISRATLLSKLQRFHHGLR